MSYVRIDVDLRDIDDDDLLVELMSRDLYSDRKEMYLDLFGDEYKSKLKLFTQAMDRYTLMELEDMFKENLTTTASKEQLKLPI